MTIAQMHTAFRTLCQQMGLQLVRGILPESIDIYLNDAIIAKVQEELLGGVRTALQDSVNTQAMTVSPINTFRTLYRTVRYPIDTEMNAGTLVTYYNSSNSYTIISIPTVEAGIDPSGEESFRIRPMIFLGFSVEYEDTLRGNPVACRMIGSDVLETTLRDYCNGASKDSPIALLNSIPIVASNTESDSIASTEQVEIYINQASTPIKYLNVKYVKQPNTVVYSVDTNKAVNCDLPSYTHFDIVRRAVLNFYQSVTATPPGGNNQQQRQ